MLAARVEALFNFFQAWKIQRLQHAAQKDGSLPPPFKPPKPTQDQGLLTIFKVIKESLETPKFEKSMRQCFIKVGLWPDVEGKFVEFSYTKKGTIKQLIPPVPSSDDHISVGEIAAEVALTSRPKAAVVTTEPGAAGSSSDEVEVLDLTDDDSDAHSSDEEDED